MTKSFKGKIALDIRHTTPDWERYLPPHAPEGAPNVLLLVWDDVGYSTMDVFGGPVETPNMRRIADRVVKFANFHTTALCPPTRASLPTRRNATSNGLATIAELSSGSPGFRRGSRSRTGSCRRCSRSTCTTRIASASGTSHRVRSASTSTTKNSTRLATHGLTNAAAGTINWVQLDASNDDNDHPISPEERRRVAMARQ